MSTETWIIDIYSPNGEYAGQGSCNEGSHEGDYAVLANLGTKSADIWIIKEVKNSIGGCHIEAICEKIEDTFKY